MATYLLVHGAYHGAWCWHRIVPRLEAAGHRVLAPDLPGHGADTTPLGRVSLAAYVERVAREIRDAPDPVTLVGHSMAGIVLSQAAERLPEGIARLVYLTAYMLRDGESVSQAARADRGSRVVAERVEIAGAACVVVSDNVLRAAFYHDATARNFAYVRARVGPQALAPFRTPLALTPGAFGRVPRVYIRCLDDRAISPAAQAAMVAALPGTRTLALPGGHSPFLTDPARLAELLLEL